MWLDEIDRKIDAIVELVRPEMKGEIHKLLKELRDDTIQQTMFEFKKGMGSLITHIEKHIDKPLKTESPTDEEKPDKGDKPKK